MIVPPTNCFYVIRAEGEVAGFVAAALSLKVSADIQTAMLVSADFIDDIQATVELDNTVELIKGQLLDTNVAEAVQFNPLYFPSTQAQIDDVLDSDEHNETFRFVGMDGSPFTVKTVNITTSGVDIIEGKVIYKPFELPSYFDIINAQRAEKLQ